MISLATQDEVEYTQKKLDALMVYLKLSYHLKPTTIGFDVIVLPVVEQDYKQNLTKIEGETVYD